MTTVKYVSTNYVVITPTGVDSNITLRSDSIIIDGNLTVTGQTTAVNTVNTVIEDNVIVLNQGETGNGVSLGTAGVSVDRGTAPNTAVIWNEPLKRWMLTNDGYTYANLVATNGPTLSRVHDDPEPWLGGNLNLGGYTIFSNVGNLNFTGNLQIEYSVTPPTAVANTVTLYTAVPGLGGSGLHTVSSSGDDELVTRTRAILYAIVL